MTVMLSDAELIAFVSTADVEQARDFYSETLGLSLVEENPAALVYEAHGTMLRVTPVPDMTPAPYTVLGWAVDDIANLVERLGSRGVVFQRFDGMEQDELGIWRTPGGGLVAWFKDPAGNILSLTQFEA